MTRIVQLVHVAGFVQFVCDRFVQFVHIVDLNIVRMINCGFFVPLMLHIRCCSLCSLFIMTLLIS